MPGYEVGPTIPPGEHPWGVWEQDSHVDDGHAHIWESCLLAAAPGRRLQEVIRCQICNAPRCGSSTDPDPCMERRHHQGIHITLAGGVSPVGGYLP